MSKTYDEFIEVVTAVRTLKLENDITGKRSGIAYIATNIPDLTDWGIYIVQLCKLENLKFINEPKDNCAYSVVSENTTVYLPLTGLINKAKVQAKFDKEVNKLTLEIDKITKKLSNKGFTDNAPVDVVDKQRAMLVWNKAKLIELKRVDCINVD